MVGDLNFNKIIETLNEMHKLKPEIRFGQLVQTAIDNVKKNKNIDLHMLSSKEIYTALKLYKEELERKS